MRQIKLSDTVMLSGWLFADLLLGLMVIFLVSAAGAPPPVVKIPRLTVNPSQLDPSSSQCTGGNVKPQCTVTLGETADSVGSVDWSVTSDFSTSSQFSPASGTLSPGRSTSVSISVIACQDGSFTFTGSRDTSPVVVSWRCIPPPTTPERLDFKYQEFAVTVHDLNGLLNNSPQSINDIEQQVKSQPILQGHSVGLAVVYGGAPTDTEISQAQQVATKIYSILGMLGQEGFAFQRASYYVPLYSLGGDATTVKIDVYLFRK